MSTRLFQFAPGEFYHIYNRGVEKRTIFLDQFDYRRFTELLYAANTNHSTDLRSISRQHDWIYDWDRGESLVAIGAYCLMPNHYHMLLTPLVDKGVSLFMNKLGTSYSMYFNRRYNRTSALFEGKFKAKHATTDEYLKYLYSCIHLNPVKLMQPDWKEQGIQEPIAAFKYAQSYQYSSLQDMQSHSRPAAAIVDTTLFPEYFPTAAAQQSELLSWLHYDDGVVE